MTTASLNSVTSIQSLKTEETLMNDTGTVLGNPLAFPNTSFIPIQTY